jgi:hypothetical protein
LAERRAGARRRYLFAYGIAIELGQSTDIVGRTASVSDAYRQWRWDCVGLAIALWLGRLARTLSWLPTAAVSLSPCDQTDPHPTLPIALVRRHSCPACGRWTSVNG